MNKNEKKRFLFTTLLCVAPMILGIIMLPKLPDQIAIHFDIHNQPDNYLGKNLFILGIPVMMCGFQIFLFIGELRQNTQKEANKKMTQVARWIIPILSNVVYLATIAYALHEIDMRVVCMILIGVMLIVMGNYIPKTKQSRFTHIGISHKLNDKNYKKLARVAGYLMILTGLLFVLSIFFHTYVSVGVLVFLIVWALGLAIESFRMLKNEK